MTDLALAYDGEAHAADLCVANGDLALDGGLGSLALMSLLTDARATPSDLAFGGLDASDPDLRGWWADAISERPLGGRLWTLARVKTLDETRRRAADFARAALAWMVEDLIAASVDVTAARIDGDGSGSTLALGISIRRPAGDRTALSFDFLWRAME